MTNNLQQEPTAGAKSLALLPSPNGRERAGARVLGISSQPLATAIALLIAAALPITAIAEQATNASTPGMLLIGPLGHPVTVSTNSLPPGLLPPPELGLKSQVPTPARGGNMPESVFRRLEESREGKDTFQWFPPYQPRLAPYLASQDELGNTAIKPGSLLSSSLLDVPVQQAKYRASQVGLHYSLQQTFTWVNMTDVMQGNSSLGYYTLSWKDKWTVFDAPASGAAGWISTKINAKFGLGSAGDTQSAKDNLGSVTDPTGIWSSVNGVRIPELAWQQSLRDGQLVMVTGMLDQSDYFDANSYANSGRGQFLNSALINSMVMRLPAYNLGLNLQWQPADEWYGMIGGSVGQGYAGVLPWTDFNADNWSLLAEFGYAPRDFLGLGPGVYRIQPFFGRVTGTADTNYTVTIPGTTNTTDVTVTYPTTSPIQAGLCFNFQQQLGQDAPFGWFGRFGHGGSQISSGAKTQIGTGFVMRGPLEYLGLCPSRSHDAAGIGFVWSRAKDNAQSVYHTNEFVLEAGYVLQLTPTAKLQPDVQIVWNPAHNPDAGPVTVFQLQFEFAW